MVAADTSPRARAWIRRGVGAALTVGLSLAAPVAQQQAPLPPPHPQEPQPTFRTGVNVISVDAIVTTRNGELVDDLTIDDFEIAEDGTRQTIDSLELIRVVGTADPGEADPRAITSMHVERTEAARDDVRLFVIFFDDYHVELGSSLRIKQDIVTFIRRDLGPKDLLAVMTPRDDAASLSFTREHELVVRYVMAWQGRRGQYDPPLNEAEARIERFPGEVKERIRNQVSLTALQALAGRLGNMREGRKSVLLISEGYPDFPHGDHIQQFLGDQDLRQELLYASGAANRNNVTFYPLDPRGLAAADSQRAFASGRGGSGSALASTQETLRLLARETDGRAIVDRNDLGAGLRQMVRDASAYYLLGYTSSAAPSDGRFHTIRVRVRRPGVDVRARTGYWARRPEEAAAVLSTTRERPSAAVSDAIAQIDRTGRSHAVRSWLGFVPDTGGQARVIVAWEPVSPAGRGTDVAHVTVMAASDSAGPVYRGRAGAVASPSSNTISPGGMTSFVAPTGTLQVRLTAEDANGSVIESDTLEIDVPDFSADAVSTPAFFRGRTQRDMDRLGADPQARPTATRAFSRMEKVLLRFATGASDPAARLLTRDGQEMSALAVRACVAGGPFTHEADVPVASLSAGEFVVEVSVGAPGAASPQYAALRVGS